jgi:tetrahydromethanopterin S-methyltransferase subunit G
VKQYRFNSGDFVPKEQVPDAVLSEQDLRELQRLAGVEPRVEDMTGINISRSGMEKQRLEREHNIKPGTPEWFQLWFSLPYLTGEKPVKD